jgi:malonate-semialdehyde dehydrogenase (acetylating)/methylmalonate-semialdehyde dehydrogenase
VNIVNGGVDVVNGLCEHPDVRGVSFVGSTPVAKHVYRTGTHAGKRVQALGGAKNFIVVMPDANLDKSIGIVSESCYGCAGERCLAGSIVVTIGKSHGDVRERLVAAAKSIRVGDGADAGVSMGPVIRESARQRVVSYIEKGIAEGADLLLDGRGHTVKGREKGFFLGPTVFDKVNPKSSVGRDEIFGPVLSIMNVPDLPAALELLHAHPQANTTSIFTTSGKAARDFALQAPSAMVGVNVGVAAPMAFFPFGGSKESFFGDVKAHGRDGVIFYTEQKVVIERWF